MDPLRLVEVGDAYTFAIIADPQLSGKQEYFGDWAQHPKLNYREYYKVIQAVNEQKPAFVLINGDLVGDGTKDAQYRNFIKMTKLFEVPVFLAPGNHDLPSESNFLSAQQEISGFQDLYYSFDVGDWHYVVLPVVLSKYDAEPMLQWLAADMQANQTRNTTVFTHFPYMPQGLTQFELYVQNPLDLRSQILDEVLRYGNTKYWYAGHVHNGIQASVKTAWEYRGATFITAPTVVVPSPFGEEYAPFEEGLTKGGYFMTVNVDPTGVSHVGQLAGQPETFTYPETFPTFSSEIEPRWFEKVPNFEPQPFTNGGFEQDLDGWLKVWRYQADQKPGFITRTTSKQQTEGERSLLMQVRERGQKWADDELTEVYQIVEAQDDRFPVLSLDYRIDRLSAVGGGYIRIHAYDESQHHSTLVFHFGNGETDKTVQETGRIFYHTGTGEVIGGRKGFQDLINQKKVMFWDLNESLNEWHSLDVDLRTLYQDASQFAGTDPLFNPDKLFIALGTWNGREPKSKTRVLFDNVTFNWSETPTSSTNNEQALAITDEIFEPQFVGKSAQKEVSPLSSIDSADVIAGQLGDRTLKDQSADLLIGQTEESQIVSTQDLESFQNGAWVEAGDRFVQPASTDPFALGYEVDMRSSKELLTSPISDESIALQSSGFPEQLNRMSRYPLEPLLGHEGSIELVPNSVSTR